MGERTQYSPGTFSWADLTTSDQSAAKEFYTGLFGWEWTDMPVGDGVDYSMAAIHGRWVGAVSPQPQQLRDTGAPAAWSSYITVEDVQAAAARAAELGATVIAGPFDVMTSGRMASLQDPQGAAVNLWQPRDHIGAGLVNAPGALCWNELGSPDPSASARFYGELLGWTTRPMEGADPPYLVVMTAAGTGNGGIRPPAPPDAPPAWLVYFAVAEMDGALSRAAELGATVLAGATDIGIATVAVVADPQGAGFALYDGHLDP
jgi:predicted enzyme related to lactoylglutathione lyase